MMRPGAVILAAGSGERIGTPKHRLPAAGGTFLGKAIRMAHDAGCEPVICVVAGEELDRVRSAGTPGISFVVNPAPGRGMLSSLAEGVRHAGGVPGVFVFPVDHPYVAPATVHRLMECALGELDAVVKPEYLGRGGHPVYVPSRLFSVIMSAGEGASLRSVIQESGIRVMRIHVADEGVVQNVNTPGDLH